VDTNELTVKDKQKLLEDLSEELNVRILGNREELALERKHKLYTIYVKGRLDEVKKWASEGLSGEQIATRLGISRSTLTVYNKVFPDLEHALMTGRDIPDVKMVNTLNKVATGYYTDEEEVKITRKGEVVRTTKKVYHEPKFNAIQMWLHNRKPKEWSAKQEIDHNISVKPVQFEGEDDLED